MLTGSTPCGQRCESTTHCPWPQEEGQADSEEEEILNKKQSEKIQWKNDRRKRSTKVRASCLSAFHQDRPVRLDRWVCARGQGARALAEENQGPQRQITLPSWLSSCNKSVYCSLKKAHVSFRRKFFEITVQSEKKEEEKSYIS